MDKSIDELTLELDTLVEENRRLKEKLNLSDEDLKLSTRLDELEKENKSLRDLVEKSKKDLASANELVANTMRNYSTRTNDKTFFNNDDGMSEEQKRYEEAKKAFEAWGTQQQSKSDNKE